MPDPTDGNETRIPLKFTLANGLIYGAPYLCFAWFGPLWKVISVIFIGLGVWRSPGFLRRAFGVLFLISLLIWGEHARTDEVVWPGPPLFIIWWWWSFGTRWHADGAKAENDDRNPPRGWE